LRVHRGGLAGIDAEEFGVEVGRVVQESASVDVGRSRAFAGRVVEPVEVPAPVLREAGDRVGLVEHQPPEVFRVADAAGVAAAHTDDRDGLVRADAGAGGGRRGRRGGELPGEVVDQVGGGGVVEGEGGG
jgi:hypothetical protein